MKLTKKQAWPIVSRVFPEYKGRKFTLEYGDNVTFWDLNWSGGSRTYYAAVQLNGDKARVFSAMPAPWNNPLEGESVALSPNVAVVTHTFFQGKDCGIHILVSRGTIHSIPQLVA